MQVQFIPIDYDYFDYQGKTYTKIIGRTDKNKKICLIDSFQPFFWAILKPKTADKKIKQIQSKIEKIKVESASRTSKVIKTELHNKKFLGKEVKAIKIFITNYKDAHAIADEIGMKEIYKRREYDLTYITKYIIARNFKPLTWYKIDGEILNNSEKFGGVDASLDLDLVLEVEKITELKTQQKFHPKILAYDIETNEFEIGKGEILMISLYGENYKKVFTWKKDSKKDYVEHFEDEIDMLEGFVKAVKEYDPDILTGYFSDGFDLPYLRARAEKNKFKLNLGIDNSQPSFSRGALMTGKIKGIVHIDLLRFIRNAYSQYLQSETLSLNEVSSELLGDKKIDLNAYEEANAISTDWEKFFEYNLKDSELTYRLLEKAWPDLLEITKITNEPLFNVSRTTMAGNFEDLVIHNLQRFNEIAEKRPPHDEIGKRRMVKKYEGALVLQPTPGFYNNIGFFDFSSMYASVIVSYNLSLSTSTKNKKNTHQGEYLGGKAYFSKTPTGFIPLLLKEIIDKRRIFKQEYNENPNPITKARSNAFKLIANAAYGYQGFFGARYYSIESASSTAFFARENIKQAIDKIKKAGYPIIYSDTDSIAFELKNHTEKQALTILKEINKKLPGIMALDLEDFYKRGIWVTKRTGDFGAKKKYALIDKNNKIKIRGFETVRRDWCRLARDVQNKVLNFILHEGNEKKALEYVKKIIKQIKTREIDLKQLIIKTQLKKPIEEYKSIPPHVTIAKRMREQGIPVDIGMLIEYYIGEPKDKKKKALVRERAKLLSEKGKYDIDYYLNNQILPAIENIFEVFKVNTKELVEGKQQKKLFEF